MKSVQTGLRLPADMFQRLQQDPDGVSEAIRVRLARSFARDRYDEQTRILAEEVMELATLLAEQAQGTAWHQHPQVHEALVAAVKTLLEARAPKPETAPKKIRGFEPGRVAGVGKVLATNFIHNRMVEERKRQEIAELEARLAQLKGDK